MLVETAKALGRLDDLWTPVRTGAPALMRHDDQWCVAFDLELATPPHRRWRVILLPKQWRIGAGTEFMIHDDVMELGDKTPGIEASCHSASEIVL